jgi:hypothetical protein
LDPLLTQEKRRKPRYEKYYYLSDDNNVANWQVKLKLTLSLEGIEGLHHKEYKNYI